MLKDKHCMRMSMEDIASQVGFSNRQSFYAAFYKRTGCTPRDFRMKAINEIENQKKERLEKRKSKLAKAQAEKAK